MFRDITEISWRPILCQFTADFMNNFVRPHTPVNFTEISWCPGNMSIYLRFHGANATVCQFTQISWCTDYVNLQRFHGAPTMSIYRDFQRHLWCPDYVNLQRFHGALADYVNLQRFHGAPTMSIYRDFMVPRLCQFTEISWCPDYVNLQRFHGAPTMSIYRDFMVP